MQLQKEVMSTQKQPSYKKKCADLNYQGQAVKKCAAFLARVKKSCEISQEMVVIVS